jgi:TetR/AcrR family transcriptional repressor of nem operon
MAVLDANWEMMAALLDEAFSDEVSPLERIDRFVRAFSEMLALTRQQMGATPGCPLGNLAAELSAQDDTARARITQILDTWARYFANAIGEAQARGEIDRSIDPSETALAILSYLQGRALMAKAYDRPELVDHAQAGIRSLLHQ